MASASQIRELLRSYLECKIDLQQFAERFESLYSVVNMANDFNVLSLADQIEAYLGRVSSGYSGEDDLKAWLQVLSVEPEEQVNQMIVISPFPLAPSVNRVGVGEKPYRASFASSDTSPEGVFSSAERLRA